MRRAEEATTVEEYLLAVRAQAAGCPQVVRVEHAALGDAGQQQQGGGEGHVHQQPRQHAQGQQGEGDTVAGAAAHACGGTGRSRRGGGGLRGRGGSTMASYIGRMVAAGAMPSCPEWAKPQRA